MATVPRTVRWIPDCGCHNVEVNPSLSGTRSRVGVGVLLGLAASLSFATSGPFVRPLFAIGWTPGAAVFWRITIAAVVMLPLGLWTMRHRMRVVVQQWRAIVVFGVAAVATPQLMYFAAVSRMSVSIALLIEYMSPVLLVLVAWARTRKAPTRMVAVGSVVSVAGLLCVLNVVGEIPDAIGVLCAFGAMIGAASYFVMSARLTAIHPAALAAFGLVVGAFALGLAIMVGVLPYHVEFSDTAVLGTTVAWWVPLGVIAIMATAVAYGLGIAGIGLMGERLSSFVGLSEVLFAAVLAALLLGEMPTAIQIIGGVLIVAGVVCVREGAVPRQHTVVGDALVSRGDPSVTGSVPAGTSGEEDDETSSDRIRS